VLNAFLHQEKHFQLVSFASLTASGNTHCRVVGLLELDVLVGDGVLRAHDWRREVDQGYGSLLRGVAYLRPTTSQRVH
jgi:hypothetical protein